MSWGQCEIRWAIVPEVSRTITEMPGCSRWPRRPQQTKRNSRIPHRNCVITMEGSRTYSPNFRPQGEMIKKVREGETDCEFVTDFCIYSLLPFSLSRKAIRLRCLYRILLSSLYPLVRRGAGKMCRISLRLAV